MFNLNISFNSADQLPLKQIVLHAVGAQKYLMNGWNNQPRLLLQEFGKHPMVELEIRSRNVNEALFIPKKRKESIEAFTNVIQVQTHHFY